MANFLENVFEQLQKAADRVVLREVRGAEFVQRNREATCWSRWRNARAYLRQSGLQPGDRCALLGPNSIRWAAIDLALMAEGVIVVPLYSRQAPAELAAMMQDSTPRLLFVAEAALGEGVAQVWPAPPRRVAFDESAQTDPSGKECGAPQCAREGRSGHHHLHLGNFWRAEGRLPEHEKSESHAGLHDGLDGPTGEIAARTDARVSIPAV